MKHVGLECLSDLGTLLLCSLERDGEDTGELEYIGLNLWLYVHCYNLNKWSNNYIVTFIIYLCDRGSIPTLPLKWRII